MKILVNQKEQVFLETIGNVPELVQSFYSSGRFPGQMITEFRLDGIEMPLDVNKTLNPETEQVIELTTVSGKQAYVETTLVLADQVLQLVQQLNDTHQLFRMNVDDGALNNFYVVVDMLKTVYDDAISLEAFKKVILGNSDDYPSLITKLAGLEKIIEQLLQAQESQDWLMLADLMEYELIPHINNWLKTLEKCASE